MDFSQEEFDEILNIFRGETEEIIQKMNNNLLQLENNPNNKEILVYLFRDAHSLKGAARMIGFNNIQRLAHKIEDVLGYAKENQLSINNEISDALYNATDLLSDLIQNSVRLKKEYYSDNIQKQIDIIDSLLEKYKTEVVEEEQPKDLLLTKLNDIAQQEKDNENTQKKTSTINAVISEAFLILTNIEPEKESPYIETFTDTIKQLESLFEDTSYHAIKNEIKNIKEKYIFVLQNSNIMTTDELQETKARLNNITKYLNKIYEEKGIKQYDFHKAVEKSLSQSTDASKIETDTDENSARIKDLIDQLSIIRDGFSEMESNLTHIPTMMNSLDNVSELSKSKEASAINNKLKEILGTLKNCNTLPEKEVIAILKQCLTTVEKIIFDSKETTEDISLVVQRLDIIRQMLDLNSSVNPLTKITSKLDDSSLPVKKAQDFFNSFETTSIKTLRVDSKKLDRLVNQMGELIIGRIKHKKNLTELEDITNDLIEWKNFNHKSQSFIKYYDRKYINNSAKLDYSSLSVFSKQIFSIFQENSSKITKLFNRIQHLQKSIDEEDTKLNIVINQLETMIKNIRVLPLATIFHMFPRMIRDISKDTGKDIELLISGSETSADKKVIEEIKAPLMHIIRNSIDHGIESPEERIAAGKSPKGKIYLIAKSLQNKIIIEIHDDGRGIDLEKVVKKAVEKKLISAKEAEYLSAEQIMNIIFWPGFTTEEVVTELSGRGVGLDIVQTKIAQLNGSVKIFSVPGQGTKITIELPVSMSTLKAFIVQASGQIFAMPMTAIKSVSWVLEKDIYKRNNTKTILIDGKSINLFYLSELMGLPIIEDSENEKKTLVLIESENSVIGLIVDKILGDQNILQKKLDPPIVKIKNISGITTLANGEVCLILNLAELYKSTYTPAEQPLIQYKKHNLNLKKKKEYKILIVDDSMTTRELLKNILAHWGYSYEMAKNPREAFDMLYKSDFDLILSDMEMPEMDGAEFVKELAAHKKFKNIPVVIISSYDTENFNTKIPDVAAYIKKSNFNQDYLLDVIEKLLSNE